MENSDLLDLCRVNLMEEKVQDNSLVEETERKETLKAIERKRKDLARKIIQEAPRLTEEQVKTHVEKYTMNGHYPPTFDDLYEEVIIESEQTE